MALLNPILRSATTLYLSDSYRILALDQRGHGDSEKPIFSYSVGSYANDSFLGSSDRFGRVSRFHRPGSYRSL